MYIVIEQTYDKALIHKKTLFGSKSDLKITPF